MTQITTSYRLWMTQCIRITKISFKIQIFDLQSRCFFLGPINSSVVALQTALARPWPASECLAAKRRSFKVCPPATAMLLLQNDQVRPRIKSWKRRSSYKTSKKTIPVSLWSTDSSQLTSAKAEIMILVQICCHWSEPKFNLGKVEYFVSFALYKQNLASFWA